MDYKEKYEKALERANTKIKTYNHLGNASVVKSICEIFPELYISEDERIRKSLLNEFIDFQSKGYKFAGLEGEEIVAWLEKQGHDGKKWIYEDVYLKEKEQVFQDGINEVLENPQKYGLEKQGEKIDVIENFDTEFEKQISHLIASAINKEHEYNQGYVKWTANALLNYAKHELGKQGKQNPIEWGEEEEQNFNEAISYIKDTTLKDWIKSLKPQLNQEWSEEEKARIDKIIDVLDWAEEKGHIRYSDWEDYVCYVKSLKPQNTWKPSDEQMEALWNAIPHIPNSEKDIDTITELSVLYNDLKKLKE